MKTYRLLSLLLAVVTLFSVTVTGASAKAGDELRSDDYVYRILDNGTLAVEEFTGDYGITDDLIIPSEYRGFKVTEIHGINNGYNELDLSSITIPDTVTKVSPFAFDCIISDDLVIGKNVSDISFIYTLKVDEKVISLSKRFKSVDNILYNSDKSALLFCPKRKKLNNYKLPDSVRTIEKYAFSSCDYLKSIRMNNVRKIKDNAFEYSSIETAVLPAKLNYLGKEVFAACRELNKVEIKTTAKCKAPDVSGMISTANILTIGKNVSNEKLVRYFTVYKKYISHSKYFNVKNNILYNKDKSRLLNCPRLHSLNKYKLPNSVKTIEELAFCFCKDVKTVDLNNVKKIKRGAFCYSGLKKVMIGSKVEFIGENAFYDCEKLSKLEINANKKLKISRSAFSDTALASVDVPCDVEEWVFNGCAKLKTVTFSAEIKKISEKAFYDCYCLKTVTVPASVNQIGKYALGYYTDDWDGSLCKTYGFTIKGAKGSAAEKYAKKNGFTFKAIKK